MGLLFGDEGDVGWDVAPEITGKHAGLDEGKLRNAQVLIEQGVVEFFLFSFLVGFDDEFASGVGEFNGSAFSLVEVCLRNLLAVDQGDGKSVCEPGAKFFHDVKCKGGAVCAVDMEEADKGIESGGGECCNAIVTNECVEEGEEAVDAISRGTAVAGGEQEVVALFFE